MDEYKPVKEGQIVDLVIQNIGEHGDGICRINGYVVILLNEDDNLAVGQNHQGRITTVKDKYAFAEQVIE